MEKRADASINTASPGTGKGATGVDRHQYPVEAPQYLLPAQFRSLNRAMPPLLFERVDDETKLLAADNLPQTNLSIRKLVTAILKEDWQKIEITTVGSTSSTSRRRRTKCSARW